MEIPHGAQYNCNTDNGMHLSKQLIIKEEKKVYFPVSSQALGLFPPMLVALKLHVPLNRYRLLNCTMFALEYYSHITQHMCIIISHANHSDMTQIKLNTSATF